MTLKVEESAHDNQGVHITDPLPNRRTPDWPPLAPSQSPPSVSASPPYTTLDNGTFGQFHSTLERLLRTATSQLSDIAILYAMSAKVNSQYQDTGGIFSPAMMQTVPEGDLPVAITKDVASRRPQRRREMSPHISAAESATPVITTKKKKKRRPKDPESLGLDLRSKTIKSCL